MDKLIVRLILLLAFTLTSLTHVLASQPNSLSTESVLVVTDARNNAFNRNLLTNNILTARFARSEQAFKFSSQQETNILVLRWQIMDGYYLYRDQFKFEPQNAIISDFTLISGEPYHDEFFGNIEVYRDEIELRIPFNHIDKNASIKVHFQGCTDGLCYPPEERNIALLPFVSNNSNENSASTSLLASTSLPTSTTSLSDQAESTLPFSPLLALFFGLLVAFTPCVLPMYPLITGIILGQQRPSTRRVFTLTLAYVQGMALTYTLLGLVVAAAGMQFQAMFQHPYVLVGLSLMFVLLALSMFGLYSLQLPSSLQTQLTQWSSKQQGGSLLGVFAMGAIAGLICSPCTTAPLSAILLYIAQSNNMALGAITLYLYALGMGIPLIFITMFGNRFLPRSGPWMQAIKEAFGFIILALPVFLLERILPAEWGILLWSLLAACFFAWAFILSLRSQHGGLQVLQILLFILAVIATQPMQNILFSPASRVTGSATQAHLPFKMIDSQEELQSALNVSKQQNKILMLDFYANWCVACKEFEKYTFSDPAVQAALSKVVLVQADVTANTGQHKVLLNNFNVLGLPTILFFDSRGNELKEYRITGFMDTDSFLHHIDIITTLINY